MAKTIDEIDGKLDLLIREIRLLRTQLHGSQPDGEDMPVTELLDSIPELAAITDEDIEEAKRSLEPDAVYPGLSKS